MSSDFVLIPLRSDTLAQVLAARKDGESIDKCIARITKVAGMPKRRRPTPDPPDIPVGATKYHANLFGQELPADTLGDLLVVALRRLAQRHLGFLERLSRETRRKRRIVARNAEDLYPGRPDLSVYAKEVTQGWWVGTNYSKCDVRAILRIACDVARLDYGRDLMVSFERTHYSRAPAERLPCDAQRDVGNEIRLT